MLVINNYDKSIYCTRGDVGTIKTCIRRPNGELYTFSPGDVVRFRVFKKRRYDKTVLLKDITVKEATDTVRFSLSKEDTTIGDSINIPVEYCYEMELNPDTAPQTFIGHDEDGAKVFKLFPGGVNIYE